MAVYLQHPPPLPPPPPQPCGYAIGQNNKVVIGELPKLKGFISVWGLMLAVNCLHFYLTNEI